MTGPPPLSPVERAAQAAAVARDRALDSHGAARRAGGVVHTPPPLARAIVELADARLRALGVTWGLGDPALDVIDPACGPGAFLAAVVGRGGGGARLHGLDVDPAALAGAESVLSRPARAAGHALSLTAADTLGDPEVLARFSGLGRALVVGNPPWATVRRPRPAPHMAALLQDFKREGDGEPLRERKLGALSDTYISFMRWAMAVVSSARDGGVLAMVTNHSFLDGPVHRGMRAALLATFDGVDVIDLGGNALIGRAARGDGQRRDDNVFGVRPGAVVTVAHRIGARGAARVVPRAVLRHARLRGRTGDKLAALSELSLTDRPALEALSPSPPAYRFVPTPAAAPGYLEAPPLTEWMPFHREGIQTNRDAVAVHVDADLLARRLADFARGGGGPALLPALRQSRHYDPTRARDALVRAQDEGRPLVEPIAYRPFDTRQVCVVAPLCHRPRELLRRAMGHSRFALVSVRKDRGDAPWRHFGAVAAVPDSSYLSARSSCRTRAFPTHGPDAAPNVDPALLEALTERAGRPLGVEDGVAYLLGVLSSPEYLEQNDAALRADYPRVPVPPDAAAFAQAFERGRRRIAAVTGAVAPLPDVAAAAAGPTDTPVLCDGALHFADRLCPLPIGLVGLRVGHLDVVRHALKRAGLLQPPARWLAVREALGRAAAWVEPD